MGVSADQGWGAPNEAHKRHQLTAAVTQASGRDVSYCSPAEHQCSRCAWCAQHGGSSTCAPAGPHLAGCVGASARGARPLRPCASWPSSWPVSPAGRGDPRPVAGTAGAGTAQGPADRPVTPAGGTCTGPWPAPCQGSQHLQAHVRAGRATTIGKRDPGCRVGGGLSPWTVTPGQMRCREGGSVRQIQPGLAYAARSSIQTALATCVPAPPAACAPSPPRSPQLVRARMLGRSRGRKAWLRRERVRRCARFDRPQRRRRT